MTTTASHAPLVITHSVDMQDGYEKGRLWYFSGEWQAEPDEEYLIANLQALYEDGCFKGTALLRWHIGFLLGMLSGRLIPEYGEVPR